MARSIPKRLLHARNWFTSGRKGKLVACAQGYLGRIVLVTISITIGIRRYAEKIRIRDRDAKASGQRVERMIFTLDEQIRIGLIIGPLMVVALIWFFASQWRSNQLIEFRDIPSQESVYRIDPNQAEIGEWMAIPGIGPTRANEIVHYRTNHGPFRHLEDLENVKGIGPRTAERLRPYLIFETN